MPYQSLLEKLKSSADENYRIFHGRLLKNDKIKLLGVRIPALRKIAKEYVGRVDELLAFPDEYYEVTFIKLTAVSYLKYEDFIKYIDRCVALIDNWATCDCFSAKCIKKHRDEFIPYVLKYAKDCGEYTQRYALVTLLGFYADEQYADLIFETVENCDREKYYYVHMASAWLIAEMLVKHYETAKSFLLKNSLDKKTHNKAIQKALESYRLSDERKIYLKGIKR